MLTFSDSPQAALGFLISQTTYIEQKVWEVEYPEIIYPDLVPIDTSANPWATTVTYFSLDKSGKADWIDGRASDIPLADVQRQKFETDVHMAGIGYDYTLEEINQARMLGMSLDAMKAKAARRAYEELCQKVAFTGDTAKNFTGLLNNGAVARADVPNGASTHPDFARKTPAEILADINAGLTGIFTGTKMIALADTLLLPPTQYSNLATAQVSSNYPMTIMAWIIQNNIYTQRTGKPLTIRALNELTGAGNGGTDRMVFYRYSDEVVKMHVPMPLTFLAPEQRIFRFLVPGMFRLGGVDVRLPGEMRYYDGI